MGRTRVFFSAIVAIADGALYAATFFTSPSAWAIAAAAIFSMAVAMPLFLYPNWPDFAAGEIWPWQDPRHRYSPKWLIALACLPWALATLAMVRMFLVHRLLLAEFFAALILFLGTAALSHSVSVLREPKHAKKA